MSEFRAGTLNENCMFTPIPTRIVGPIKIKAEDFSTEINVPLATFETPLWPSVDRGARVSRLTDGIQVTLLSDCMTRSILCETKNAASAAKILHELVGRKVELENIAAQSSAFAKLQDWRGEVVGNLLYLRFAFTTGDASGHNMTTKAAESLLNWLLQQYPGLQYVSLSGNYCTDKKVSAVNGILGRGKSVVAEIVIAKEICWRQLHVTADAVVALNVKKNLIGSILAGSIRSANAHFANMLLAFYLATGQDAANIVEGSQGIVYAENRNGDLYFSVNLPNIIVGTIGSGKDLPFVRENLALLGCTEELAPSKNAQRLALIAAATVLCGELSLLAALANRGELMRGHLALERK